MIPKEFPEVSKEFQQEFQHLGIHASFDRMTRLLYSTDASIYQIIPLGVAYPRHDEDVIAIVEAANRHGIPLLPRGGGSSLAGQAVGPAMILDLSTHMHRVLDVDVEQHTVLTQPGITLGQLNAHLRPMGWMFGPDPASAERATMGGIMSNNSTGAHSIIYGMTADHALETNIVLADGSTAKFGAFTDWDAHGRRAGREGEIYRAIPGLLSNYADEIRTRYPKTFRHVAGYNLHYLLDADQPNLSSLIVGSEGTLGVITAATLNLVPVPKANRLVMVHFSELKAAMEAVPAILESDPTAIEVLDKMLLDLTRDKLEYRRLLTFIRGDPEVVLLVEFSGENDEELDAGVSRLESVLMRINHQDPIVVVSDPKEQANVWFVRKVGLGILMSIRGDAKPIPFIEDAAVPVEHLAEYVTEIYSFAKSVGVERVAMYAHASAGCIHIRPMVNLKQSEGIRQLRAIAERSVELVLQFGGTTSGEHGEGIVRGEFSKALFGPKLVGAFREIKQTFDPDGLMNPGKIVDTPRMDDQHLLRFGSDYSAPFVYAETGFHYKLFGGFDSAVEMCNGAGVCRKVGEGVMCPSFQVTRNEVDSTRGRANALRAAMMGLLGAEGMTSEELYEVLDLCLSCQACKSECPSSVDMAKLKSEFLYQYYQQRGFPLRSRLFSEIARINAFLQPFAPVANTLMRWPGNWLGTAIGLHPARRLPPLANQTFSRWYADHPTHDRGREPSQRGEVVLFHDTFMEHNDPAVGQAAVQVLEAAGFDVVVIEKRACCGRPAVSKGALDLARKSAERNIELLYPFAERNVPIVGCEPSCMSMLRAEYPDLVNDVRATAIAEHVLMLDELILAVLVEDPTIFRFSEGKKTVLVHGHCQQKANFGVDATLGLLNAIPDWTIHEIESGCCGMAGSFGYEREHYDLSIELAQMSLAPAVLEAPPDAIICASGMSCREQIHHITGRIAQHPIQVFASALQLGEPIVQ